MRANASVIASARPDGASRCTTLRSQPPLALRTTADGLHLVGTAAGPVGGDTLHLEVEVLPGAALTVRSAAAQIVLPGARCGPSSWTVTAEIGDGGSLYWLPQPAVIARGADHRMEARVTLGRDADLVWREEVRLGRFGEAPGSVSMRMMVDRGGVPLLRQDVGLGPAWPGSAGPAGIGTASVVGTALLVGAPALAVSGRTAGAGGEARVGVFELAPDAVLVSVLGHASEPVRLAFAALGVP